MGLSRTIVVTVALSLAVVGVAAYRHWRHEYGQVDMAPVSEAWKGWAGPRYVRADCLVRLDIEVDHGVTDPFNGMLDIFLRYISNHEPRAPFRTGGHGSQVYIQFFDQCDRRFEIARGMAAYFEKRKGGKVRLTVIEERVEPGMDTLETCGGAWLDCPQGR